MPYLTISLSFISSVGGGMECCDQCFILPSLSTSLVALVVAWNVCCDQWFLLLAGEEVGEQKDDSGLFLPEISEIKRRGKKRLKKKRKANCAE